MATFQHFSARVSGLALLASSLVFMTAPASAGFEWTPPLKTVVPEGQGGALTPEMPAIPRDSVETITLQGDAVMVDAPVASAPVRPRPPLMVSEQPAMAVQSAPLPPQDMIVSAPVEQASLTMPSHYADAVGFGSDIPLALALRQIVPPEYAYAFDSAVDQGSRITWNGGKPWDAVLNDALMPHGLAAVITDKTVRVMPKNLVDLPSPMLTAPGNEMVETMTVTPVIAEKEPVREVYVRRNSSGEPMAQTRAPGTSLEAMPEEQSSFWSHFGLKSAKRTTTVRNTAVVTGQNTPEALPPSLPIANAPMVAEMHDAPVNAPLSLTTPPDAPMVQDVTAVDPYVKNFWQAEQGDSLRNVLQTWADEAGVQLFWVPMTDYRLVNSVRMDGSFTDAVTQVLSAYGENGPRPVGRLHPNLPAGPAVLIIEPSAANS